MGFFAMSARPRCARRGRRRVRGVRGATLCVVYGVEHHIQRPETLFVVTRHCVNLLEINTTSLFLITEMVTRGTAPCTLYGSRTVQGHQVYLKLGLPAQLFSDGEWFIVGYVEVSG